MSIKQENPLNKCKQEKTEKPITKNGRKNAKNNEKDTKNSPKSAKAAKKIDESEKDRMIKNEIRRLGDTFKNIDSEKKRLVKATMEDAAFLTITMQELRKKINKEGTEVEYKNGENQWGTKQSPAVINYLQMSQKLNAAMKILLECQPKNKTLEVTDGFDDFVMERGID